MNYTIEQKAVALLEDKLWWRLPALTDGSEEWTLIHGDFVRVVRRDLERSDAEYHIGDKPPRVLSDLERELLAALEEADEDFAREGFGIDGPYRAPIRAAIAKAKGEA